MDKRANYYLKKYLKLIWNIGKYGIIVSFCLMFIRCIFNILLPRILQFIIDNGINTKQISIIIRYSLYYVLLILFLNLLDIYLNNYNGKLKLRASSKIKIDLIERLTKSNGNTISNQDSGEILRVLDNDVYQLESFGLDLIFELILNSVVGIIAFVIMFQVNRTLLTVIIIIQLLLFVLQLNFSKYVSKKIKKIRKIAGKQSVLQEQFVSNLKSVVLTNITQYFIGLYCNMQEDFVKESKKVNFFISLHAKISSIFSSISTISIYLLGGILVVRQDMTMGELIAFSQYVSLFIAPFGIFVNYNMKLKQSMVALENIYGEMERIRTVRENINGLKLHKQIENIVFEDVGFSYENHKIFHEFNVSFEKDKVTVITGESGTGKSTLLALLYKLWEVSEGKILINDIPLEKYALEEIKSKICIVCQDSLILNDSIERNICLGKLGINEGELSRIYQCVGLNEIIKYNSHYAMELGESGNKISGGQKQRIAIARALVQKSDVLIFDECTSGLDNISQQTIINNIRKYFKHKIVIIIAHRLPIAKIADEIIVLKNGHVVEQGDYETLIKKQGEFYTLDISAK